MSRGPDAGTLLQRAIEADARHAGCPVTIASADWTRWASATFTGARHEIVLVAERCATIDAWLGSLPEAELAVRGHLLADLTVIAIRRAGTAMHVILEALTVED